MLKVLSTKLLGDNLIAHARKLGIELTCLEFIRTNDLDFDIPVSKYDAVVFTSSNAVKSFFKNADVSKKLEVKIFSTSGKTKYELTKHGIEPITVADDANKLADIIIAYGNIRSVLHICGNLKLDILQNKLKTRGIRYSPLFVYETILTGTKLNEEYDAVMFYSPSGVEGFIKENKLDPDVLYCCIGETTAEKLRDIDSSINVVVSKEPSPEAMLSAIKNFKIKY